MLFKGIGDLIPLYALYSLLFADHGLSTGQISSLFAIWSTTAFLLEVPSGAWADTVSRRALLILSGVLLTAGFALWTLVPTFLGFALGFVLWGTAGALVSGTFEALLYDDLAARGEQSSYARILGYTRAAAETAIVIGIVAATPLYLWGGYALIGWSSVGFAALHTVIAMTLPSAPKVVSAAAVEELEDEVGEGHSIDDSGAHATSPAAVMASSADTVGDGPSDSNWVARGLDRPHSADPAVAGAFARYIGMLKTGVAEAIRVRAVRNGVLLGALLFGITAFDEYFALLAESAGVATAVVPLLVGVTVLGSLIGSVLAGRTEGMSGRTMAIAVGFGGVLFLGGSLIAGLAEGRPSAVYVLTGLGFTAIGVSYGIVYNAGVVAGARLQDAIEGPARATVTSVSGLLGEVVALVVFAFAAIATTWWSMPTILATLGATLLPIALVTTSWLPPKPVDPSSAG
ncbi:MFS transporter [Nocardia ninae]|uniref:MFS transporter n=1 Tax=Nocardia ninae NBRC 108245 TaxID=1210091 RepID=A0A511ML83_9NOCA|nr:MFS transporter [Nocardia ninae]GEM41221.1 MFS transporter [Nocardia ninae NBRC 108245]